MNAWDAYGRPNEMTLPPAFPLACLAHWYEGTGPFADGTLYEDDPLNEPAK